MVVAKYYKYVRRGGGGRFFTTRMRERLRQIEFKVGSWWEEEPSQAAIQAYTKCLNMIRSQKSWPWDPKPNATAAAARSLLTPAEAVEAFSADATTFVLGFYGRSCSRPPRNLELSLSCAAKVLADEIAWMEEVSNDIIGSSFRTAGTIDFQDRAFENEINFAIMRSKRIPGVPQFYKLRRARKLYSISCGGGARA